VSEDSPDKMEYSRRSRARACLRASKRGNFVGNQRFLKRYVGRKTKGDKAKKIEMKNTVYASDFRTNLLSIARIVDKNREVLFMKNRAFIQERRGRVKMIADRDGDLFYRVSNNNCFSWQKKILHKIFKTVNCTYFGLFY
jgi:hypothetical protein